MICSICERDTPDKYTENHHLIPKVKKGKEVIKVCRDCGDQIHLLFSNSDLKNKLCTLELLRSNQKIQKWIKWIRKRPNKFNICMKIKKGRHR